MDKLFNFPADRRGFWVTTQKGRKQWYPKDTDKWAIALLEAGLWGPEYACKGGPSIPFSNLIAALVEDVKSSLSNTRKPWSWEGYVEWRNPDVLETLSSRKNGLKQAGETEQGHLYCPSSGNNAQIYIIRVEARGELKEHLIMPKDTGIDVMRIPPNHAKQPSHLRLCWFEYSVQTICQWNVDKLEFSQKRVVWLLLKMWSMDWQGSRSRELVGDIDS